MASAPTSRKASMAPSQAPTERAASMRQQPSRQQTKAASVRSGSVRSVPGPAPATPASAPVPSQEVTTIETPVGTVVTTENVQEVGEGTQGGPSEVVVTSASGQPSAAMVITESTPPTQVQATKSFPPAQPTQAYSLKSSVRSPKSRVNSIPMPPNNMYGMQVASDTSSGDWGPPPARPIIQQQQTMTYSEPQKVIEANRWEHSILGCFEDMGSCCLGTFCPCILFSRTQHRLNKDPNLNGWSACDGPCILAALSCCCIPTCGISIPAIFARNETRKKFALKGDTFTDVVLGFLLPQCALCQADRETRTRTQSSEGALEMQQYGNDGTVMQYPANA